MPRIFIKNKTMKKFQKILVLLIFTAGIFAADNALACDNHVRHCDNYRDCPDDDDDPVTKKSKLFVIISSGDVDLGTFVKGADYDIDPPDNQIEFEIIGIRAKRFTVCLSTAGSDLGNPNNVSITTEWRFSHDYGCYDRPFINGGSYFFWNKMILGCFITSIHLSQNATPGSHSFEQVLTVHFIF
jgi:hypothetical protein